MSNFSRALGEQKTHRLTHSLTDWCFDREIKVLSHQKYEYEYDNFGRFFAKSIYKIFLKKIKRKNSNLN